MIPVHSVSQVFDAIRQGKASAADFSTNFFPVEGKLQGWIDHGELFAEEHDGAAFFFKKDRDFWHFYFCAASRAVLMREFSGLPILKTERVVVDFVGNGAALSDTVAAFESEGFRRHAQLRRMSRTSGTASDKISPDTSQVVCAKQSDCDAILALLECSFDRYSEQLPTLYEIELAVERGQVLIAKREGAVAGLLFFETQGFTSMVRYWLVAEPFRALHLGSTLIQHYFNMHGAVRRFVLWVNADNDNAIEKYRHYGYAPDGLVDHVLVNKMIRA